MAENIYKLQTLKKLLAAGSLLVALNTFDNPVLAQASENSLDTANIPKKEIFHYAREVLDMEKQAGFDVKSSHYQTLDSIINETAKYIHIGGVAEESKKEQALNNLKNISEIFRIHKLLYSSNPDILLHKSLETKKLNSYNCLALYLEIAEKTSLPITSKKVDDHYFIEYELGSEILEWETTFGIEKDNNFYKKQEKEKKISEFNKERFLGIANRTIGISLYKQGKCEKAMKHITKALDANIAEPRTNKYEGDIYNCLNKEERAIESYTYAIEFEKSFLEAYISRGEFFYKKGKLSEALKDFSKAIELNPENPELYKIRGDVWSKKENQKQAEKDYLKALELILSK